MCKNRPKERKQWSYHCLKQLIFGAVDSTTHETQDKKDPLVSFTRQMDIIGQDPGIPLFTSQKWTG